MTQDKFGTLKQLHKLCLTALQPEKSYSQYFKPDPEFAWCYEYFKKYYNGYQRRMYDVVNEKNLQEEESFLKIKALTEENTILKSELESALSCDKCGCNEFLCGHNQRG